MEPTKDIEIGSKKRVVFSYAFALCIHSEQNSEKFEEEARTISRWRRKSKLKSL